MAVPEIVDPQSIIGNTASGAVDFETATTTQVNDLIYVVFKFKNAGTTVSTVSGAGVGTFAQRFSHASGVEIWWGRVETADEDGNVVVDFTVGSAGVEWLVTALLIRGAPAAGSPFDPQADLPKLAVANTVTFSTENAVDLLLLYGFNQANGAPAYDPAWDDVLTVNWFQQASQTINSLDVTSVQTDLVGTQAGAEPAVQILADAIMEAPPIEITVAQTIPAFGQTARLEIAQTEDIAVAAPIGRIILVEFDVWQC